MSVTDAGVDSGVPERAWRLIETTLVSAGLNVGRLNDAALPPFGAREVIAVDIQSQRKCTVP